MSGVSQCVLMTSCCVSIILCFVSIIVCCVQIILCCVWKSVCCVCRYGPPYPFHCTPPVQCFVNKYETLTTVIGGPNGNLI